MNQRISAIVTAYERIDQTLATLRVLQSCVPTPDEILVHVDADQVKCEQAIRKEFPDVRVLRSHDQVGPGGGRNKLMDAARHEFVASFDDDSMFVLTPELVGATSTLSSGMFRGWTLGRVHARGPRQRGVHAHACALHRPNPAPEWASVRNDRSVGHPDRD